MVSRKMSSYASNIEKIIKIFISNEAVEAFIFVINFIKIAHN